MKIDISTSEGGAIGVEANVTTGARKKMIRAPVETTFALTDSTASCPCL
nr:hypothetical protein [Burkholderia sp. M701]